MPRSRQCCMHYIMSCYSFAMQVTAERSGYHRSVIRKSLMPFIFIIYCIALPRNYISNPLFFLHKNRWSVGSLLFLLSWMALMGPFVYLRHLISGSRLPFTAAYFGSIALTLYFAIGVSLPSSTYTTTRSIAVFPRAYHLPR